MMFRKTLNKKNSRTSAIGDDIWRWRVAVAFVALVFLTGGSSRFDTLSFVVLRPAACFVIAYFALVIDRSALRDIRVPLGFLAMLALLITAQIIPLPPSVWSNLPIRDIYHDIYNAGGIAPP